MGEPEYSYYFVLKAYLPLLERLGTVETISSLDEAFLQRYEQQEAVGSQCVVLAFAPPHKIPRDLACRVVPVFAWEYSTLPEKSVLGSDADCWVSSLAHFGEALCLSDYAKNVVLNDVGPHMAIESIPAPLRDNPCDESAAMAAREAVKQARLRVTATGIDSHDFIATADVLHPRADVGCPFELGLPAAMLDESFSVHPGQNNPESPMFGFYPPESWGAWTRSDNAWALLPKTLLGNVRLRIAVKGFGENLGREIVMHAGTLTLPVPLTSELVEHVFEFETDAPLNVLRFSGLDHAVQASADDQRHPGMGLGIIAAENVAPSPQRKVAVSDSARYLPLSGIVYTSILNPRDGRKNWEDILTAFCYAFRDESRATLVLKMTCQSASEYLDAFFTLLCKLHPFQCRVVVLHGFLESDQYAALLDNSTYVVNASRGEGQCLPLIEFMSEGVPAVAPKNTAMADYVAPDCAFIVQSTPEPTFWPHDNSQLLATFWYRTRWESLFDAYQESFRVATEQPKTYAAMSRAAIERLHNYGSIELLSKRLQTFLSSDRSGV